MAQQFFDRGAVLSFRVFVNHGQFHNHINSCSLVAYVGLMLLKGMLPQCHVPSTP